MNAVSTCGTSTWAAIGCCETGAEPAIRSSAKAAAPGPPGAPCGFANFYHGWGRAGSWATSSCLLAAGAEAAAAVGWSSAAEHAPATSAAGCDEVLFQHR